MRKGVKGCIKDLAPPFLKVEKVENKIEINFLNTFK
uniref:Uncharacterized protein n=1 Tax=viral metagenome TaxID=1070528 RepID=A0A6C0JEW8_9ZZZZ